MTELTCCDCLKGAIYIKNGRLSNLYSKQTGDSVSPDETLDVDLNVAVVSQLAQLAVKLATLLSDSSLPRGTGTGTRTKNKRGEGAVVGWGGNFGPGQGRAS